MSRDVPEGWATPPVGQIAVLNPRHSRELPDTVQVTFIPMAAVSESSWRFNFTLERRLGEVRNGFSHFVEGDVLFAKITPCMENGKGGVAFGLKNGLGCGTTELVVFRPRRGVSSKYLYFFLHQPRFRDEAARNFAGAAGQLRVPTAFVESTEVPLAPVAEQLRIVARLEELLGRVDACKERLARVSVLMKRFRRSVLAAACSGRLTADWRDEHVSAESASELLLRIRHKRTAAAKSRKELDQIAEAFQASALSVEAGEAGCDVPASWILCRVGTVGRVCNGSTPPRKEPQYWRGEIPWVSSGEVRNNVISRTRECITKAGLNSCSVQVHPVGTVLLAMIGEGKTRGQSAVLAIEATINQNIAAVILDHGLLRPEYLWHWFQFQYWSTRERGGGSGPQALNCQRVRELPVALPPFEEQHEIIRRVEALFALAKQIEVRHERARAQVGQLTPALLGKAFHGELVRTEADLALAEKRTYEPAAALLERIRTESDSGHVGVKRKRAIPNRPARTRRRT